MAIPITSIGVKVSYAFESVAGTRPTTGYTHIPGIKESPEMNPQPETLETTSFDNVEYKTYVNGLKDLGGVIDFTANYTQDLIDLYNTASTGIMALWEIAKIDGKAMYLCIDVPEVSNNSVYISVIPSKLGLPAISANSVLETVLHFTPVGEPIEANDPQYVETTTYDVTVTGYVSTGVDIDVIKGDSVIYSITTADTSTIIKLPNGDYTIIARKFGKTTQVEDLTVESDVETVTFTTFA